MTQNCSLCEKAIGAHDPVVTRKNDRGNTIVDHAVCGLRHTAKFWRDRAMVLEHYFGLLGALLIGHANTLMVSADDVKEWGRRPDAKIDAVPLDDGGFLLRINGSIILPARNSTIEIAPGATLIEEAPRS